MSSLAAKLITKTFVFQGLGDLRISCKELLTYTILS